MPTVIEHLSTTYYKEDASINPDYPVLIWQTDNDELNLINSENAFIQLEDGSVVLVWQAE